MGSIQSLASKTYEAPNGETLVRGDYLPTSYAGDAQVLQCERCDSYVVGAGDTYQQMSVSPYHGYCSECETCTDKTQVSN